MKPFKTLTEQELVALSEDDVQRYIDYACAEEGVPLLPTLPPAPVAVNYEPDAKLYSLGHWLHFQHPEQAARVLEAIKEAAPVETDYLQTPTGVTSTAIAARRSSALTIVAEDAFTAMRAAEIREALAGAKRAEDIYNKAKKAYDSAVRERDGIASDIRDTIAAAWEKHERRESLRRDYERYLSLADGNSEIAARFLANAHGDAQVLLPDLFVFAAEPLPTRARPEPLAVAEDDIAF